MTTSARKFGPVLLAPGVLPRHVLCYLFAAFVSIGLYTYLVALTPYVLTINLGLPESEHGTIAGDLNLWQEIMLLASLGLWGALSDRFGRRIVYVFGFVVIFLAYALYAFAATPAELIAYRLVFALGVAATTTSLAAVLADYSDEGSRGKLTGIAFFLNGVGAVIFSFALTRLPQMYSGGGADELWAGRYAGLTIAGVALLAAIVMLGLKPGRAVEVVERKPVVRLLAEGMAAGRRPRIGLSYLSAFAARADMAIVTLFLNLWAFQAATGQSMSVEDATARAGMTMGTALIASVFAAPVIGWIADRIDRLSLLIIAFSVATIGYGWVSIQEDILAASAIPALLCLGAGLSCGQLAATVLLATESPAEIRGSTFGVQAFFGALGILALSAGGGRLFDQVGPHAPFVAIAIANGVVLGCSVLVRAAEGAGSRKARAGNV